MGKANEINGLSAKLFHVTQLVPEVHFQCKVYEVWQVQFSDLNPQPIPMGTYLTVVCSIFLGTTAYKRSYKNGASHIAQSIC